MTAESLIGSTTASRRPTASAGWRSCPRRSRARTFDEAMVSRTRRRHRHRPAGRKAGRRPRPRAPQSVGLLDGRPALRRSRSGRAPTARRMTTSPTARPDCALVFEGAPERLRLRPARHAGRAGTGARRHPAQPHPSARRRPSVRAAPWPTGSSPTSRAAAPTRRGSACPSASIRRRSLPARDACACRSRRCRHRMPQSLAHFFALGVPGILLEADGRVYHNAGATEAQELGAMLATRRRRICACSKRRARRSSTPRRISASASASTRTSSCRWPRSGRCGCCGQRAQQVCGIEPSPATIHAETSWRMMTKLDPETNILRTTLAAFAAGVGGADSLSVLPHTIAHGLPDGVRAAHRAQHAAGAGRREPSRFRRRSGLRRGQRRGADRFALRGRLGGVPDDRGRRRHAAEPGRRPYPAPRRKRRATRASRTTATAGAASSARRSIAAQDRAPPSRRLRPSGGRCRPTAPSSAAASTPPASTNCWETAP